MIELGSEVEFEGRKWIVVADNSMSKPHPNGTKHWDYIIKNDVGASRKIRKEDLRGIS